MHLQQVGNVTCVLESWFSEFRYVLVKVWHVNHKYIVTYSMQLTRTKFLHNLIGVHKSTSTILAQMSG